MKQHFKWIAFLSVGFLCLLVVQACKKQEIQTTTTDDVNIVDYMRKYPEKFSEFLDILDRTNVSSFLNAYGAYTVFAPTNEAIDSYLKEINKTSINAMDSTELKALVKLHIIRDTISTPAFTDGKMATPTMYGQYLITSVNNSGVTVVNRRADIVTSNILTGNGYIHVIDHVLVPAKQTLAAMVEQNPAYSIFTQALKATGLYDTLNMINNADTTRRWLTLLAEPDTVLNRSGIFSYSDLVNRYHSTDPKNTTDSLYLYTAYHILTGIKYVADIASAPSHPTLAPMNVVTSTLTGQTVLLNEATFNGVFEPGIVMDRSASNNLATNGVMHSLLGDIFIKKRSPVGVYWDVADQPEIRKNVAVFRKPGKYVDFSIGQLKDVTWQQGTIRYSVESATSSTYFYWGDKLEFGLRTNPVVNNWIEFKTPLIVAGKYKVWIGYRRLYHGQYTQVFFDGNPMSKIVDLQQYLPKNEEEPVMEAQGFKRYLYDASDSYRNTLMQLAGIVNVETTDRHTIRLQAIKDQGKGGTGVWLDMIEFIPIDKDQQYPRFARDGSEKKEP